MSKVVVTYYPVGSARELIMARDREVVIEGPAGTGKTVAMMYKLHMDALKYPGIRILLTRKVGQDLTTGALDTYHKHVRPELDGVRTYGGSKFHPAEYRYPNGSVIIPSGLDKSDKVMSSEYDKIAVNEVTGNKDSAGITQGDWEDLTTRLRNNKMPYQQIMGDCNPGSARHWINLRMQSGQTRRIKSTHKDNPAYWDQRRQTWTALGLAYVKETLEGLSGVRRTRLLEGVWASAEGLVYEFESYMEVRNRDIDLTGWRKVMGADVGSRNPTAIGRAHVSGDERVHFSKCLYRRNMNAREITAAIRSEADEFEPDTIYIDPSAKMIIDELRQDGYPVEAANNAIEEGIRQVRAVMSHGFTIDPDECPDMINEFGMYAYPTGSRIETDKPVKDNDHAMDMCRYVIVGATEPQFDLLDWYTQYA